MFYYLIVSNNNITTRLSFGDTLGSQKVPEGYFACRTRNVATKVGTVSFADPEGRGLAGTGVQISPPSGKAQSHRVPSQYRPGSPGKNHNAAKSAFNVVVLSSTRRR